MHVSLRARTSVLGYARNAQTDAHQCLTHNEHAQAWLLEFLRERWADRRVDLRPPATSLPPDVAHASLIRAVEQLKLRKALILMADAKPRRPQEWLLQWLYAQQTAKASRAVR